MEAKVDGACADVDGKGNRSAWLAKWTGVEVAVTGTCAGGVDEVDLQPSRQCHRSLHRPFESLDVGRETTARLIIGAAATRTVGRR